MVVKVISLSVFTSEVVEFTDGIIPQKFTIECLHQGKYYTLQVSEIQ